MKSAPDTPNVVEACNLEGRQERLDGLLGQLEICEKALQVKHNLKFHVCQSTCAVVRGVGRTVHTSWTCSMQLMSRACKQ